jgi:acetoin utilization deacetylase AcuC-like enzyme
MKYFYPKFQSLHKPKLDLSDGLPGCKHLEVSQRVDGVLQGLLSAKDFEVVYVDDCTEDIVRLLHDDDYVEFLVDISKEIDENEEYIPSIFRDDLSSSPLRFRGGMYSQEIGTPIMKHSIKAALNSANATHIAAKYISQNDTSAFVLTRPPGHHAGKRRYGGYCFFNNAYIGVRELKKKYKKVAVVDIDYHIGDGSVEFADQDAPYYSINAKAKTNYPYEDAKLHYDKNIVKIYEFNDKESGDGYIELLKNMLRVVVNDGFDAMVLSLGFDTLADDGYQDDKIFVEIRHFREIGKLFGDLDKNILIVLEGGYDASALQKCAKEFMEGFLSC